MQEQNFEKQVRRKMDELSLSPSAPVWNKVEEQIRKKKDRRRIVLWLLPLGLNCQLHECLCLLHLKIYIARGCKFFQGFSMGPDYCF